MPVSRIAARIAFSPGGGGSVFVRRNTKRENFGIICGHLCFIKCATFGEVAEWSIAAVLKTVDPQGSGGSNPSLSAT